MTETSEQYLARLRAEAENQQRQLDVKQANGRTVVVPTYHNALIYLSINDKLIGLFQFNRFCHHVEITKQPPWGSYGDYPAKISDTDILHLKTFLLRQYRVEFPTTVLNEAVSNYSSENGYDPVKDYLEGLKWDGKERVKKWLTTYMKVKHTVYSEYVGMLTLGAACARVDKPGCKYDYMTILEGRQDIGKSFACQILGGAYYREISLVDRTKDTVEKMQGAWIVEVAELAVFKKQAIESLKAFITNAIDEERLPYERRSRSFPRRSILIGTINPDHTGYLSDTTGNRRFLPVMCESTIDLEGLRRDRDQLFAEAWVMHKSGLKLFLPAGTEISAEAMNQQAMRESVDDWQDLVKEFISNKTEVRAVDVWTECLKGFASDFDRFRQRRVAECLVRIGWVKGNIKNGSKVVAGYVNPDPDAKESGEKQLEINPWDEKA